jgi:undecaprenyl-diphosphatase
LDLSVTQWINEAAGHNAVLDNLAVFTTTWGVPIMVALVLAQWWIGQPRPNARYQSLSAGAAFLLGLGAAQVILLFVHRSRPYDAGVTHLIVPPTTDWSFPSDHAIASMSIVWTYMLQRNMKWLAVFSAFALLICWSRVFVGMHYVSDVLGGAVLALASAVLVQWIYRPHHRLNRWLTSLF